MGWGEGGGGRQLCSRVNALVPLIYIPAAVCADCLSSFAYHLFQLTFWS